MRKLLDKINYIRYKWQMCGDFVKAMNKDGQAFEY